MKGDTLMKTMTDIEMMVAYLKERAAKLEAEVNEINAEPGNANRELGLIKAGRCLEAMNLLELLGEKLS